MKYQPRILEGTLKDYLRYFPVVGLTGPRQSGKSTLLQHTLPEYTYVTFDDYRTISLFHNDPMRFLTIYADKIIFDEVQKLPELFSYIKIAIDRDRSNKGKFILTGSSQFSLIKNSSESLAGRIGLLSLLPFQYNEIPATLRDESVFRGGYPELVDRHYAFYNAWFSSYVETYIHKDIASLGHVGDTRDFRRLLQLLAANTSQQLNMTRYASDLGVDVKTIKRWISLLEASYIIFLLPPFYKNYGKRLVKSPKIYFYDVGLVSFLTGIENKTLFENGPLAGPIFENYLISEILKKERHTNQHSELYYLRTSHGKEIDIIIDRKNKKELIEIKNSATFNPQMAATITEFIEEGDQGYLLYRGENLPYHKPISILNYANFLSS
jgi:predicted AAA+ superfamily ATPase